MPEADFKYRAFISYSHRDRKWGERLHRRLETYRTPKHLVGKPGADGPISGRLFPIFRDRDELPVSANLTATINAALAESAYLVVVCSPNAAKSRWVNEEIRAFRELGRADRILTFIVDGEPDASDPEKECFPPELRLDGTAEGIAADARHDMDGYENATLKLLATLLGAGYDQLKQRDHERRIRRLQIWTGASLLLVLLFLALGVALLFQRNYARQQEELAVAERDRAEEALAETRRTLSQSDFSRAQELLRQEQASRALAYLARAIRTDPSNRPAADLIWNLLLYDNWILPASEPVVLGEASGAKVAPDGRSLLVWSDEVWAMQGLPGGEMIAGPFPVEYESFFGQGAFSADSQWFGLPVWFSREGDDFGAQIFKVATGQEPFGRFQLHGKILDGFTVAWATFDQDSSHFAATAGTRAEIYNLANPAEPTRVFEADATINLIGFSNDDSRVATTVLTDVLLWDSKKETGSPLAPSPIEVPSLVQNILFAPDDSLLAVALWDNSIRLVNPRSGEWVDSMVRHQNYLSGFEFADSGEFLMSASKDGTIHWTEPQTGMAWARPTLLENRLAAAGLNPDATELATVRLDDSHNLLVGQLWRTGPSVAVPITIPHDDEVTSAVFSPDGRSLATGSKDGTTRIIDLSSGEVTSGPIAQFDPIVQVAFLPTGTALLTAAGPMLTLADVASGEILAESDAFPSEITALQLLPNEDTVIIGTTNGEIYRCSSTLEGEPEKLYSHDEPVTAFAVTPSGTCLFSGSNDNTIRAWSIPNRAEEFPPLRHEDDVTSLTLDPDGKMLLSTSKDDSARLWDATSGEPATEPLRTPIAGVNRNQNGGRFDPRGEHFLTIGGEFGTHGIVVIRNGRDAIQSAPTLHHDTAVLSAAFSPDGQTIVSATLSGEAQVWDAKSGAPLGNDLVHEGPLRHVDFTPRGNAILTVAGSVANLWCLPEWNGSAPPWLAELAEYAGGLRLTSEGAVATVSPRSPSAMQESITPSPNSDLALWFLAPPAERPAANTTNP